MPCPPIALARAPYNPLPGFTLPQLISALTSLPQSQDSSRRGDGNHPASADDSPHSGLRLLVRIEGSHAELPILAITESAVPNGFTLVLLASEPPPGAPPSPSSSSTTTPTPTALTT